MNPELVLQVPHAHLFAAFGDEQAQAPTVGNVRLAAGQREQNLAAAVGDEPLHAVEEPVALLVLKRPQSHRLQIAAGIGLGEHHSPRYLAAGESREHFVLDLLAGKGVDRLRDSLQAEEIRERSVGPAHDLVGDGVDQVGAVQPAVARAGG